MAEFRVNVYDKTGQYLYAKEVQVLDIKGPQLKPMSVFLAMPHRQVWFDRRPWGFHAEGSTMPLKINVCIWNPGKGAWIEKGPL